GTINIGKRTSDFIETNVYGGECMVTFSCVSNGVIMVTKLGNEKDEVIVNFSISFEEFEQKHKEVGFNSPIYKK
ncbi:MAG: hypothetical protein FWC41_08400, partial [Firmicutes bacterium]|nr:hypothetical protein [Bacillota bacterium]